MANQYTGSFEHKVKEKFNCSAEELLRNYAEEGLTYQEVEEKTGIALVTIRKWAKRYGIELENGDEPEQAQSNIRELFFAPHLNIYNFLSRRWQVIK